MAMETTGYALSRVGLADLSLKPKQEALIHMYAGHGVFASHIEKTRL